MKVLLPLLLLLCACDSQHPGDATLQSIPYTNEQRHVHSIIEKYSAKAFEAPNELQRRKFRDSIPIMITRFLNDTIKLIMRDFYVTVGKVNARPFGDIYALTVELSDDKMIYWMERDYKTEKQMLADPMYHRLANLKENEQRNINLGFVGQVEPDYIFRDKFRMKVLIMPDSLTLKNKP